MSTFDEDEDAEVVLEKEPVIDWGSKSSGDAHDSNHTPDPVDNTQADS